MKSTNVKKGSIGQFGKAAEHTFFTPGRINLIGEHTDYNGGHIFPYAITLRTYAAADSDDQGVFLLYSDNFPSVGIVKITFVDLAEKKQGLWADYFQGMAQVMQTVGLDYSRGLNIYISGNLPDRAGLSSSASPKMLVATILSSLFGGEFTPLGLAKFGVRVENDYIGIESGIMDQFAIEMGKENRAMLLDTNTIQYDYLPVEMNDNVIVIMNTSKRKGLVDSKYSERRSEYEQALVRLQKELNISSLGDLAEDEFDENTYLIYDPVLIKRACHAAFGNMRALNAAKALQAGNLKGFEELVSASGVSLAYDCEVTGPELDALVATALKQAGVLDAKMTGAGFEGCAITIVNLDNAEDFINEVGQVYRQKIGYDVHFYIANIADGIK